MPHAATLQARENRKELGSLLISSTRLGTLLLLATGLPLIVFAFETLKVWIGPNIADSGESILAILIIANMVRLIGVPYSSILVGTGQQKLVIVSPVLEGITNLLASIILGLKFGAIGVAYGTLAGSIVGILGQIFYNLNRTQYSIEASWQEFLVRGIALPSLCGVPVYILYCYLGGSPTGNNAMRISAVLLSLAACAAVAMKTTLWAKGRRAQDHKFQATARQSGSS